MGFRAAVSARADREQGFTLIELLVVVGIIGILASIAVPAFNNSRKAGNDKILAGVVNSVASKVAQQTQRNEGNPPASIKEAGGGKILPGGIKVAIRSDAHHYCVMGFKAGSSYSESHPFTVVDGVSSEESATCPIMSNDVDWEG